MFTLNITGDFKQKMTQRIDAWKVQRIGALIYAPDSLKWWLYQEYGTASRGEFGGGTYAIDPVHAEILAFPGKDGNTVFAKHIDHPGIPPRHSVEKAIPDIESSAITLVQQAFEEGAGDDPTILQAAVVKAVEVAKDLIVQSLASNIPGTRIEGKLTGQSAASVFDAEATVQEITQGD